MIKWVWGIIVFIAMVIGFVVLARWTLARMPSQVRNTIAGLPVLGFILVPNSPRPARDALDTGTGFATG